jgi:hypothetical protein
VDARPSGVDREHLAVIADGGVVRSLAFVGLRLSLVPLDGSRSHLGQLLHGQESEVPKNPAGVVKDLRVIGIKPIQLQGYFHRIAVSQQPGVGLEQL